MNTFFITQPQSSMQRTINRTVENRSNVRDYNKVLFEAIKLRDSQAIDRAVTIHAEDENVFLN